MTYQLFKEPSGKFEFRYTVKDQDGNVISTRTSARHYVACTIHGNKYFGKISLIRNDVGPIAYLETPKP